MKRYATLDEATTALQAVIIRFKKVKGFRIKEEVDFLINKASEIMLSGNEVLAIRKLAEVEEYLQRGLIAFFYNSPSHFMTKIDNLALDHGGNLYEDVQARLDKHLRVLAAVCRVKAMINIDETIPLYEEMCKMLIWAREEEKGRQIRREAREAEEQLRRQAAAAIREREEQEAAAKREREKVEERLRIEAAARARQLELEEQNRKKKAGQISSLADLIRA